MSDEVDPDAGRDFRTYIPQSMTDAYLLALGRLIHECAKVETLISLYGSLLIEHKDASNLFGSAVSVPTDPVVQSSYWKERMAARNAAKLAVGSKGLRELRLSLRDALRGANADAELLTSAQRVLDHLGEIQAVRDRLVHHGAVYDLRDKRGWMTTSNDKQTTAETGDTLLFKPSHLDSMSADLQEVSERLNYLLTKDHPQLSASATVRGFPERLKRPFKYKRSQLICYPNGGPNSKSNDWLKEEKAKRSA